jgi:hypothetical protein
LFDKAGKGVVIIDTSNYYPDVRDARIPEVVAGTPETLGTLTRSWQLDRSTYKGCRDELTGSERGFISFLAGQSPIGGRSERKSLYFKSLDIEGKSYECSENFRRGRSGHRRQPWNRASADRGAFGSWGQEDLRDCSRSGNACRSQ